MKTVDLPFPVGTGAYPIAEPDIVILKMLEPLCQSGTVRISRRLAWSLAIQGANRPFGHSATECFTRLESGEAQIFGHRIVVKPHLRLVNGSFA